MHPLLEKRGYLALYLVAWLPIGVALATALALSGAFDWTAAIAIGVPLALVEAFICLGAFYFCRAVPLRGAKPLAQLGSLVTSIVFSASLLVIAGRFWLYALQTLGLLAREATATEGYRRAAPILLAVGGLLFALALAIHYLLATLEASAAAERRALELEVTSREAELRALRAQINPHFLFNSLNSISSLAGRDAKKARQVCSLLGDFLRASLSLGSRDAIPLSVEIDLAEKLLQIEKIRFGDRLSFSFEVEPGVTEREVPPLLLLPLVENAVTHGIAALVEGGDVVVCARRLDTTLEITIENAVEASVVSSPATALKDLAALSGIGPGRPRADGKRGTGLGLQNVRRRVATIYGRRAEMAVTAGPERFRVALRLPLGE
jgi:hypothetical protein